MKCIVTVLVIFGEPIAALINQMTKTVPVTFLSVILDCRGLQIAKYLSTAMALKLRTETPTTVFCERQLLTLKHLLMSESIV